MQANRQIKIMIFQKAYFDSMYSDVMAELSIQRAYEHISAPLSVLMRHRSRRGSAPALH